MLNIILERWRQGHRTAAYPDAKPALSPRFRGLPVIDQAKCPSGCEACVEACPTDAISLNGKLTVDLGRCLFCSDCQTACPEGAIAHSTDHRLAVRNREDLVYDGKTYELAKALDDKSKAIFGRSLHLRQISAGGCNGCEADVNVLTTLVFDLSRFGIKIVASPRHADVCVVTGPVTENMKLALRKCYDMMPSPKWVVAVGACAISGGSYVDHPEQHNGTDSVVKVDLYIPGCPPSPWTILDGLLRLMGRLDGKAAD
ncbi:MAG TPA: NADH-quinone oxidoreductase subunit NuoB [Pirellulales bacterium]